MVMTIKLKKPRGGKVIKPSAMDPEAFIAIRKRLGWTQTQMGTALGVGMRTVQHWEHRTRTIPPMAVRLLGHLIDDPELQGK
jgi:DNA-binding transcriptional regulator YiaG